MFSFLKRRFGDEKVDDVTKAKKPKPPHNYKVPPFTKPPGYKSNRRRWGYDSSGGYGGGSYGGDGGCGGDGGGGGGGGGDGGCS